MYGTYLIDDVDIDAFIAQQFKYVHLIGSCRNMDSRVSILQFTAFTCGQFSLYGIGLPNIPGLFI